MVLGDQFILEKWMEHEWNKDEVLVWLSYLVYDSEQVSGKVAKYENQSVTLTRTKHDGGGVERVNEESLPFLRGLNFSFSLNE